MYDLAYIKVVKQVSGTFYRTMLNFEIQVTDCYYVVIHILICSLSSSFAVSVVLLDYVPTTWDNVTTTYGTFCLNSALALAYNLTLV